MAAKDTVVVINNDKHYPPLHKDPPSPPTEVINRYKTIISLKKLAVIARWGLAEGGTTLWHWWRRKNNNQLQGD
jgi:hypothetical protein